MGARHLAVQFVGLDTAASSLVDAASDVILRDLPNECYLLEFGYQITTTIACSTAAPVIEAITRDYDDAANATVLAAITIATGTVAANAWKFVGLSGTEAVPTTLTGYASGGIHVAAGRRLALRHSTQGTDASAAAGACRMYAKIGWILS